MGGNCNFHVRVDGVASTPNDLGAVITANGDYTSVSTTNIFTGLAAGTCTISLGDRGVKATECMDNLGNYQRDAIVTEQQP